MAIDPRDRTSLKRRANFFAVTARHWLRRLASAQSYEEAEEARQRFKQAQGFKKEYRRLAGQAWIILTPEEGL